MSFKSARLEEFLALRDPEMYGIPVSRNGTTVYGIATPVRIGKRMTESPFVVEKDTVVDLLRTDYITLGLAPGAVFQMADASGIVTDYMVKDGVKDDAADCTIQFPAAKKQ